MINSTYLNLTITIEDPDLDDEEKDLEARRLLAELKSMDEVEQVSLAASRNETENAKSGVVETLIGILTAEISAKNIKAVLERLEVYSKRSIEMEIEGNGRKLKLKVNSQRDLEKAIEAAQKFVSGT